MNVVTAAEMREIDRSAIEDRGIPGADLMERAGQAIAEACADLLQQPGPVLVLCGKGNNGGDGFVAARYLAQSGYDVYILPVFGTADLKGDARSAHGLLPGSVRVLSLPSREEFRDLVLSADAVIDAILGTGSSGELRTPLDWIAEELNSAATPVIAADIPTGLDADTGESSLAIRAAVTVTIGRPKIGMLSPAGIDACGRVRVEPVQFPTELLDDPKHERRTLTLSEAAALLPPRPPDSHKGTFGTAVLFAGSTQMPGAAILCAIGALRSGAGLVRVATPRANRDAIVARLPECLHMTLQGDVPGTIGEGELARLENDSESFLAGPGCTTGPQFARLVEQLLRESTTPLVLDADAITILAKRPDLQALLSPRVVLTPHPGEMARLTGGPVRTRFSERWSWAADTARKLECTVVLKGFGTLVADPQGRVTHVPTGNTALARGGSGDVLAGMICGLLAQGCGPADAAALGAFVCGLAADIAIREVSPRGLATSEIADRIPAAWREIERNR